MINFDGWRPQLTCIVRRTQTLLAHGQPARTTAEGGAKPVRRLKLGTNRSGILALVGTTSLAIVLPSGCQGIEDSIDGRYAAGALGILIGALILFRAYKEYAIVRSRPFFYGRCLKAASAMAGAVAIVCYDGELSPCFVSAFLLAVSLVAASFALRLWGLVQIARSEKARRSKAD